VRCQNEYTTREIEEVISGEEISHWEKRAQYIYLAHNNTHAGRYLLDSSVKRICGLTAANSKSRILEVGCAAGTYSIEFWCKGFPNIFGVDIGKNIVKQAFENSIFRKSEVQFQVGDAYFLPYESGLFDMVFSIGVMEHLSEISVALGEQKRVLKRGGKLLISVPNFYSPWWSTGKRLRSWLSSKPEFDMPTAFRTFRPRQLAGIMEAHGLTDIAWEIGDVVLPQCPDILFPVNVVLEKVVSKIPLLRNVQAMLYVVGSKV